MGNQKDKDKVSYLDDILNEQINSFHSSVRWYRRKHFTTSMSVVILSALITILAGWKGELLSNAVVQNVILVSGVLSTVVSAWGAFFTPKESWHLYATTLSRLRSLQTDLNYKRKPPNEINTDEKVMHELLEKYQNILADHNKVWLEIRSNIRDEKENNKIV